MATITDALIRQLKERAAASGENLEVSDDACKGLRVRVGYGGATTFSVLYRPRGQADEKGKLKRLLIGKYGSMTADGTVLGIAEARRRATKARGEVADGGDPLAREKAEAEERRRKQAEADQAAQTLANRITVRQLAEKFLHEKRGKRWCPRYRSMLSYNLLDPKLPELQLDLADKAAADLTSQDIDAVLGAIQKRGSEIQSRRVYETLRAMLRFGVKKGFVATNPITAVSVPANATARERVLTVDELRVLWRSLTQWDEKGARKEEIPIPLHVVRALRLQLLLATRSGEISGLCRDEVSADGYSWTIPTERSKNGDAHTLPLPPLARQIVATALKASDHKSIVFPVHARDGTGYKALRSDVVASHVADLQDTFKFKDRKGEPAPWIAHDLRRSAATYLKKLGVPSDVVSAILNHRSETMASVTARHYTHDDMAFPMREALTKWQAALEDVAEGLDPFARNVEDIEELEARITKRARGPRLVAISGGRS